MVKDYVDSNIDNLSDTLTICRIKNCLIERIKSIDDEINKLELEISEKNFALNYYQGLKKKIELDQKKMRKYLDELENELNVLK